MILKRLGGLGARADDIGYVTVHAQPSFEPVIVDTVGCRRCYAVIALGKL